MSKRRRPRRGARTQAAIVAIIKQQARAGDVDAQAFLAAREPREIPLFPSTLAAPARAKDAGSRCSTRPDMALQFTTFADLVARQVRRRLPTARYEPATTPSGPARLSVAGAIATMTRDRAYWRVTFERTGQAVTMSGLSGERFDEFVAGNVGNSIATFLEP